MTRDSCGVLNVNDMLSILRVLTYFSKKGVPRILYLIFATAKGITRVRVFPWREVWSVSIRLWRICTSDLLATVKVLYSFWDGECFEQFKKWSAKMVKVGKFKTQMDAPLSSKNNSSNLEGIEVSSLGLKRNKLTNQVEGVRALACSVEVEKDWGNGGLGWYMFISKWVCEGELLWMGGVDGCVRFKEGLYGDGEGWFELEWDRLR